MEKHIVLIDEEGKAQYLGIQEIPKPKAELKLHDVSYYRFDTRQHAETFEFVHNNPTRTWNS